MARGIFELYKSAAKPIPECVEEKIHREMAAKKHRNSTIKKAGIFSQYNKMASQKRTPVGMEENLYPDAISQRELKDEARSARQETRAAADDARKAADEARKAEAHPGNMAATAAKVDAERAKMPYKMGKGLKRGLLAAGGLAIGGAGVAAALNHRRNKEEESMMKESMSPKGVAMLLGAGAAAGAGSTIGAKQLANTYLKSKEQREMEAALAREEVGDSMESLGARKKSSVKVAMEVFDKLAVSAQMASRALSNMEKKTIGEGVFAQHAKNPRTVAKSLEGEGVEFPRKTTANMTARVKPMAKAAADGDPAAESRWSNRQAGGLAALSAMLGGGAGYGITRGIVDPTNRLLENIQPVTKKLDVGALPPELRMNPNPNRVLDYIEDLRRQRLSPGLFAEDVVRLPGSKLKALGAGAGAIAGLLTAGKINNMMHQVTPEQHAEMLAQYNANR